MDEHEFKQILKEGKIALNKERERLKNDPRRPRPWEEITPEPLKPAIEHIRKEFRTREWQLSSQVECGCYLALHPELANAPKYKGLQNLIQPHLRPGWRAKWEKITESERFHYWREQYADGLEKIIREPFDAFLRIALTQRSVLSLPSAEWTRVLASNLIYSLQYLVPLHLKNMCDEQGNRMDFDHETFDAYCSWVYWRAPRLVHMEPSGNTPYDQATAWVRENAELTEHLLRGLTSKMLDPAQFELDRLAGKAHVSIASSSPIQSPSSVPPPSSQREHFVGSPQSASISSAAEVPASHRQDDGRVRETGFTNIALPDPKLLPAKKMDLSDHLDQAQLTDRQRECASLRWEYGFTVTAIADRLDLSRRTIDEHLEAADRKIQMARAKDKAKRLKGRFNPEA